eukprot:4033097-Prymnesium_polylepis.1
MITRRQPRRQPHAVYVGRRWCDATEAGKRGMPDAPEKVGKLEPRAWRGDIYVRYVGRSLLDAAPQSTRTPAGLRQQRRSLAASARRRSRGSGTRRLSRGDLEVIAVAHRPEQRVRRLVLAVDGIRGRMTCHARITPQGWPWRRLEQPAVGGHYAKTHEHEEVMELGGYKLAARERGTVNMRDGDGGIT